MKLFLSFITFLLFLTVQSQTANNKDSIPFIYIDDTENYVHFPGGDSAFRLYLSDNIVFPDSSWEKGIQGTVYVQFSIDTSGKISDAKIIKGLTPDIEKTVLSVMSNMPPWQWTITRRRKCTKTLPIVVTSRK